MDLSKIKLIATDMDGTLLNSNHEVSEEFFKLFKQLKALDILFVAASGRPFYSMVDKLSEIKDDIIIVSENGGIGVDKDVLFISNPIKTKNFKGICKLLLSLDDAHAVFCAKSQAYVLSHSKMLHDLLEEYYPKYSLISNPMDINEPIYKVALFHEKSSEHYIYPHVRHLENQFKVKVSAKHWVDISENIANKGHAIELIQKIYTVSPDETMVFGDYNNDIEMLKLAKFSFAMANAHPDVKAVASYKTKSNDDNGVEYILEQTIKAKQSII